MPNFRFYVADSSESARSPIDVDLPSATEARIEAIKVLAEIAYDILPDGNLHDFVVRVTHGVDVPLFEATLSLRARWLTEDVLTAGGDSRPDAEHSFL